MEISCEYCGKKFDYNGGKIHFNRSKKHYCSIDCLCKSNITHGKARKINGKQDKRYRIWCGVKKRAKRKKVKFELSVNDIPEIPIYCPVLGIKIKENDKSAPLDSSPSLDRINPREGYVKGNIRIISNRANRIKSDATLKELGLILKDAKKI